MKLKIGLMIIFMILSINNVYALTDKYEISYNLINSYQEDNGFSSGTFTMSEIGFSDVNSVKNPKVFQCYVPITAWSGGNEISEYSKVFLYSDSAKTNSIGSGIIGYIKLGDSSGYYTQLFIDTLNWGGLSGTQFIYWSIKPEEPTLPLMKVNRKGYISLQNGRGIWTSLNGGVNIAGYTLHTTEYTYNFINNIEYIYNPIYKRFKLTIFRNSTHPSKWYVNDTNTLYKNEGSLQTNNETIYSYDLNYSIWNTYVITDNVDTINKIIDFSPLLIDLDLTAPTLTTDKTYYNTSEEITINYTNIQSIYDDCTGYGYNSKCEHPYELYILYPIYSDNPYNQWDAKYQMYLPYYYATDGTGIKYDDGSITLNTSILSPQNTYVIALLGKNGYYGKTDDIQLFSDSFTVYPANEYLNTNCEGREVYVGTEIIIYYKIDNNSNIIIKDNDNNIINQYYNIINEGELIYTIPDDLEHLNTYPNWKIYLNNTDYDTSYNQDLTVYWSEFIEPTPVPTFTPQPTPDINISDQLDNLNTEIKPLKDLMFGLVYIVVDNPDYNTDNIISEHEINNWLNSIIPLCLFLCLIILYIGLHKKRE